MSARSSSFSLGTLVQYAFLAVLAYVLAGAPLLSILSSSDGRREIDRPRNVEISKEKLESLVIPEGNLTCGEHAYRGVYVLSREPLVVYIEGFLTEDECGHVVELRCVLFVGIFFKSVSLFLFCLFSSQLSLCSISSI